MVPRLLRSISRRAEGEPTRTSRGGAARLSRRELEIALQQFKSNRPRVERAELFVQRSRVPDRVRMRVGTLKRWGGTGCQPVVFGSLPKTSCQKDITRAGLPC